MSNFQLFPDINTGFSFEPVTWIDSSKTIIFNTFNDHPCHNLVPEKFVCFTDHKKNEQRNRDQLAIAKNSCELYSKAITNQLGLGNSRLTGFTSRERRQIHDLIDKLMTMIPLPPIIREISVPVVHGTFDAIREIFSKTQKRIQTQDTTFINSQPSADNFNRLDWCQALDTHKGASDFGAKLADQHFRSTFHQLSELSRHNFEIHSQIEAQILAECEVSIPIDKCSEMIHARLIHITPSKFEITPTGAYRFEFKAEIPIEITEATLIHAASTAMLQSSTKIVLPKQMIRLVDGVFEPKQLSCIGDFCKAPALIRNQCATGLIVNKQSDCEFIKTEKLTLDSETTESFTVFSATEYENCRLCGPTSCSKLMRSPVMITTPTDIECASNAIFINHQESRNDYDITHLDGFVQGTSDQNQSIDWIISISQLAFLLIIVILYHIRLRLLRCCKLIKSPSIRPNPSSNREDSESHISVGPAPINF